MAKTSDQFDIPQMIRQLTARKSVNYSTVLVLGARTGGLFRSQKLYETLLLYSDPSFAELSLTRKFGACYRTLTNHNLFSISEIDTILTQSLAETAVTDVDLYLAEIIKFGFFDLIVSTNVDDLLEQALKSVGMRELRDFDIYNPSIDTEKSILRYEQRVPCRVFKVFGQHTTGNYTIRRNAYWKQYQHVEKQLEALLKRDILAIGLDPLWDAELYRAFHPQGDFIWFVNEDEMHEHPVLPDISNTRHIEYVGDKDKGSYNYFIKDLYRHFSESEAFSHSMSSVPFKEERKLQEDMRPLLPIDNKLSADNQSTSTLSEHTFASTTPTAEGSIKIYVSYAARDERLLTRFVEHMALLKHEKLVSEWHSRKIGAGLPRSAEINVHLNNAAIILLLVSSSFLASDYIYSVEMTRAMELQEMGQARVIPILMRPVDWKSAPFGDLVALPANGKPVTRWSDLDSAFLNIVESIRAVAEELKSGSNRQQ